MPTRLIAHQAKLPRTFLPIILGIILIIGAVSSFYYSFTIPLHVDEGGHWFNYTNKDFANRKLPTPSRSVMNHSLTVYAAKLTLFWFGYNGVGYRFSVIFFGLAAVAATFFFSRIVTGSALTGWLSAAIMMLVPWFGHYSHEARGYVPFIFFASLSFISLNGLITQRNHVCYWILLLVSFLGAYYSTLSAVIFIFTLMATIWILKISQLLKPQNEVLTPFREIPLNSLLLFSGFATAVFLIIILKFDLILIMGGKGVRGASGLATPFDIFSAFLGYEYLDDPESTLYQYPAWLYTFSLLCCFYGLVTCLRKKNMFACFFLVLYFITILFILPFRGAVLTRAVSYFLPFVVIFQACGLKAIAEKLTSGILNTEIRENTTRASIACILLLYSSLFTIGKYQNVDAASGNSWEKTLAWLTQNSEPDSLIIADFPPHTLTAFYLGKLIRDHTKNIYQHKKINAIYYLTGNPLQKAISLKNYGGTVGEFIPLDRFQPIVDYQNMGIWHTHSRIKIYKASTSKMASISINANSMNDLFGSDGKPCVKNQASDGILVNCIDDNLVYSPMTFDLPSSTNTYQLSIFHHLNLNGTKFISGAITLDRNQPMRVTGDVYKKGYMINELVDEIDDLDIFRENVPAFDPSLQQATIEANPRLFLSGDLFRNNSILKGVEIVFFKLK